MVEWKNEKMSELAKQGSYYFIGNYVNEKKQSQDIPVTETSKASNNYVTVSKGKSKRTWYCNEKIIDLEDPTFE